MLKNTLGKAHAFLHRFEQTLFEGNYHADPVSVWRLLWPKTGKLPETSKVAVGSGMIGTSRTVYKRILWAAVYALLSIDTLVTAAAGLTVVGLGLLGLEYRRSKKAAQETIVEINFAGQRVKGTRSDLCRLHQAQMQLMNLSGAFKQASLESTEDTIQRIKNGVAQERKRVKVLDAGPYGATAKTYAFSQQEIETTRGRRNHPASALSKNLKAAWDSVDQSKIVEQLALLQQSLPPQVREEIQRRVNGMDNAKPAR